jgi:hypothetical protein
VFKIESNLEDFKKNVHAKINQLVDTDKVLRELAFDAVALISNRVQQYGLNSEEQPMKTEKNHVAAHKNFKTGKVFHKRKKTTNRIILETPYSEEYAKTRIKHGREIDHIDLTFTSQMMDNFVVAPEGKTGYVVGFRGKEASDKAEWNERRFGTIFHLSQNESKKLQEIANKRINAILSK